MIGRTLMLLILASCLHMAQAEPIGEGYAFAKLGEPKYGINFTHFDYVNPAAPKGGSMVLSAPGTYDNFNRYASRGNPGLRTGSLYDPLFVTSDDEVGSYYPLIATSARFSQDFRWAEVNINPAARFQDGSPITAEDVEFTFAKLMSEGVPQFRVYFKGVTVKALSRLTVRIDLPAPDKDLVLSWFGLSVMPKKFWQDKKLNEPLGYPPLSSGPYRITSYKLGQFITYSRVKDYWATDLPVNKGRFNFDTLRYDYYLDDNVAFEAFKAGAYDFRPENSAKKWATQYLGSHFLNGDIVKEARPNKVATDTSWLAFNNQKALFRDVRVREALTLAFDFDWMNKALFYGAWQRSSSYFQNTEYAAVGYPDVAQLAILAPLKGKIPARTFTDNFQPPQSDGSGYNRKHLLHARDLLRQAGWEVKNQQLVNIATGQPFRFELLLRSGTNIEWALPFQHALSRLGIQINLRQVDASQYLRRLRQGDYDMIPTTYYAMPWPDTGLQNMWSSAFIASTWNTARVEDPAVDRLVAEIVAHQGDRLALRNLGRAFDRLLLWNYYMIPMWYNAEDRLAYWNKFSMPAIRPTYDVGLDTWWYDVNKAAKLPAQRR